MIIPPPSQSTAIIGHDEAKSSLEEAFNSGRMHHAWLITGPEGIGKATLAYHLANLVLSAGANRFGRFNPENAAARLIAADAHPDMFVLQRPTDEKTGAVKDTIPVEEARKIAPFLHMTAAYGNGRFALIDEAHALNRNGQNAILKVIEEPPPGAIIALTTTTVGALLPTIRSRCRVLPLNPLTDQQLDTLLARLGIDLPPGTDKARLMQMSGGSVGRLLKILQTETLPLFDELLKIMADLPNMDMVRVHKLGDMIGRKAESQAFDVLSSMFVDALREAVRAQALGQTDKLRLALKIAPGRLDKALELWEKTRQTFASAGVSNLDNKLAFITAMTEVRRAAE